MSINTYHYNIMIKLLLLTLLILPFALPSYLQFRLSKIPQKMRKFQLQPITCKNQTSINKQAQYHEICYEKDTSYGILFRKQSTPYFMSLDFTAPISWIKDSTCHIQGTSEKCKFIKDGFISKLKKLKKSVAKPTHMTFIRKGGQNTPSTNIPKVEAQGQNSIIEGSSEIIRGEFETQNMQFVVVDSNRLNSFFEIIMLGLFIFDEKDHLELQNTNFISASQISPNLNNLMDGSISLRFDQSSENSFLNEIFTYSKTQDKVVTVYLGSNNSLTIGDKTAKYSEEGYSGINWIDLPDNQGYGKMARITDLALEDEAKDSQDDQTETLPAVITLSASYIGLPEPVLNMLIFKEVQKFMKCEVHQPSLYVFCASPNKKNMKILLDKNLIIGFGNTHVMLKMQDLVLKNDHFKKIFFNIKKTFNYNAILGEPIFQKYFVLFDYAQNKIGFATTKESLNQEFISIVTLVRFLCFIFVIGCCFIICFEPCRVMLKKLMDKKLYNRGDSQARRFKNYRPVEENPYDDLREKIQQAVSSTDKEEEEVEGL